MSTISRMKGSKSILLPIITGHTLNLQKKYVILPISTQLSNSSTGLAHPRFSTITRRPVQSSLRLYNVTDAKYTSIRSFKDFGHKKVPDKRIEVLYLMFLASAMVSAIVKWDWWFDLAKEYYEKFKKSFKVEGASLSTEAAEQSDVDSENAESITDEEEEEEKDESDTEKTIAKDKKKNRPGFRERKIIEYENRIRAFSTPDKIFRYFATLKVVQENGEVEICMTPNDFLRSITPGAKQPDGYGLDQFRKYDPKVESSVVPSTLPDDSIFYKLGTSGLISFSDYIFLLTVLSASKRHFDIAFKMFDLNGDGEVDFGEFDKVQTIIRNQTSVGMRHRDHNNTGSTFKGVNSALNNYFFGMNREKKLTVEKFLEFQERLQTEILTLEFSRHEPDENGLISEIDFAKLLLIYAGLSEKRRSRMLKRIKKRYRGEESQGISLKDYLQFFHFLNNINDVDTALTFYHIAGASIDPVTLKHVAKTVAQVNMSDHILEVIFTLFDENQDGQLSNKEFISVMKNRLNRGLEKSRDTGFIKLMNSIWKCARLKRPVLLDI